MERSSLAVKKEFHLQPPENSSQAHHRSFMKVNSKYYKQAYRVEWESMPDFKGWLRGVPGQPTRAYCTFCRKSLHAHRLSLLKHTCTLKHTKAAQKDFALKSLQEEIVQSEKEEMQASGTSEEVMIMEPEVEKLDLVDDDVVVVNARKELIAAAKETNKHVHFAEPVQPTAEELVPEPIPTIPKKRMSRVEMAAPPPSESPLSTHVLDTAKGTPIGGLQVSLYKLKDGRWTHISDGMTNPDGRFTEFIKKADFTAGRYKIHFDVDRYFELRKLESLYPFIEIVFDVKSPQDHYHVPLLLSPFGYTTYRGS